MVEAAGDDEKEIAAQMAAEFLNEDLPEQQFNAPKAGPGLWASIVRMLDPIKVSEDFKQSGYTCINIKVITN